MIILQNYALIIFGLVIANAIIFVTSDSACTRAKGKCRFTSSPCSGSYSSGKCKGPRNRQCCIPRVVKSADYACVSNGGRCVDWRRTKCIAGVARGMCGGDANRRCCLRCDRGCLARHQAFTPRDSSCIRGRGSCQINSNYCSGLYASGKCGGPGNRQCCQNNSVGVTRCPLLTYRASHVVGYNGLRIRIESGFRNSMNMINSFAKSCRVTVHVTNAFRKKGKKLNGTIVPPATRSNHLVGHAIDMNLSTPSGWCNSKCLKGGRNSYSNCFIRKVRGGGLRWGGVWRKPDPVHIDDGFNANANSWNSLFQRLQTIC